jgi:hypothetical protein
MIAMSRLMAFIARALVVLGTSRRRRSLHVSRYGLAAID